MTSTMQDINFDTIIPALKVSNEKMVFQKISNHISNLIGTPEKFLFEKLSENEDNKNCGNGNGVAIVHAKLPRLTRPIIVYSYLPNSVDFKEVDEGPIDMVSVVLSPEFEGPEHLQRLSKVSRFFKDEMTCDALREADGYEEIRQVVRQTNEMKKAA